MKQKNIKIVSWIAIILAVANILLYALRVYNEIVTWGVIIILAVIAFPGMRMMKKKAKK